MLGDDRPHQDEVAGAAEAVAPAAGVRRWGHIVAAAGVVLVLIASTGAVWLARQPTSAESSASSEVFLTDHTGKQTSLESLRGKWLVLFFGYTHCPDVCPLALFEGSRALNMLDEQRRSKVNLVFITIDPERDSVDVLAPYIENFGPQARALTGAPGDIAHVARSFGVFYGRQATIADEPYLMQHSTYLYIVDPNGGINRQYNFDVPADQLAATLRRVVDR